MLIVLCGQKLMGESFRMMDVCIGMRVPHEAPWAITENLDLGGVGWGTCRSFRPMTSTADDISDHDPPHCTCETVLTWPREEFGFKYLLMIKIT
jgi:hypothetical protein